MKAYFNVNLEFNHDKLKKDIERAASGGQKGYVCVVDANVLTIAQKDIAFRNVINKALINTCDGSSIATLLNFIYGEQFRALNGPDIFSHYIEKPYRHLLLGGDETAAEQIKQVLIGKGVTDAKISILSLPFLPVEAFAYEEIAQQVNALAPEMIWVSLGAPKQEFFMSRLLPFLNSGVMFGIGAAFNFYIGKINLPNAKIGSFRFIWLSRLFAEPKKQFARVSQYIKILPRLYFSEVRKKKKNRLS